MVFFSKAITEEQRVELVDFLGVSEVREYEKYLGLQTVVGRKKKESLNYIKERVWHKLQRWKERLLSQVEKEVLLKAVVQPIPTFAMSCFKLPTGLIHDIERLIRSSSGGNGEINVKSIGRIGRPRANQRLWGEWASRTWRSSMRLC